MKPWILPILIFVVGLSVLGGFAYAGPRFFGMSNADMAFSFGFITLVLLWLMSVVRMWGDK